ncbi:multicopper oxidase family protein [Marinobacter sp.]|uniref:multicopper oxidase family protein n=1 Tax=Marinobacter sp. TaxID=50741 RepID=UPI00384E8027
MSDKKLANPSRRRVLKAGVVAGAAAAFGPWVLTSRTANAAAYLPGITLDPSTIPQFLNPLPNPLATAFKFDLSGSPTIGMSQTTAQILPTGPATTVWGYSGTAQAAGFPATTFPGRTFEVQAGEPLQVQWQNNLPVYPKPGAHHLLPVDTTLHGTEFDAELGPRVVPHLHGGDTESDSDGLPEQWWTPNEAKVGSGFDKSLYDYDNSQEAATIWYHDHAVGITRLNVYAGLAGFYIIRDDYDTGQLGNPLSLPPSPYDIPLAIQDRIFDLDNQLFYPSSPALAEQLFGPAVPGPYPDPTVFAEVYGDVIIVNGKAWPKLQVEPRKYRFRILNGSDTRFYNLFLDFSVPFLQIGTDQGLLNSPVPTLQISVAPGERFDVVVDFSALAGQTIIMRNNAPGTFRRPLVIDPETTGRIMAFEVSLPLDPNLPDPALPATLRGGLDQPASISLANELALVSNTRQVFLYEGLDGLGRLKPLLGTAEGPLDFSAPVTETPVLGSTEIWEIHNTTPDTHPIHLHLVRFLVVNRQGFDVRRFMPGAGGAATVRLRGQPKPPAATEAGWKDTVQVRPGEVVRIVATFNRPGRYVWHCHILSHEDHEMMRPFVVEE